MKVGVANAAIRNLDLNVLRLRRAPRNRDPRHRRRGALRGYRFGCVGLWSRCFFRNRYRSQCAHEELLSGLEVVRRNFSVLVLPDMSFLWTDSDCTPLSRACGVSAEKVLDSYKNRCPILNRGSCD